MIHLPDLETLLKITQLIGIPVAIVLYIVNKRKERVEREYGTYHALDEKYIDYLKLCLENSDLDVADTPRTDTGPLTPEQQHRELLIFSVLISIMERAFLMYSDQSGKVREAQWAGWDAYIQDWCKRENFKNVLSSLTNEFDTDFVDYLKGDSSKRKMSLIRRFFNRLTGRSKKS